MPWPIVNSLFISPTIYEVCSQFIVVIISQLIVNYQHPFICFLGVKSNKRVEYLSDFLDESDEGAVPEPRACGKRGSGLYGGLYIP